MAVGFLFPAIGSQTPNHMNLITPAPCAVPAEQPHDCESESDSILVLGLVYLQFGLPPDVAFESAIADYECTYRRAETCPR